ncbi:MAG: hypothetical protein AAFW87_10640, partial [Pseudomonadota bacterium]
GAEERHEIIWLIGKSDYYGAAEFVPFALAGLYLYTLKWNFEIGIFAAERTIWMSVVSGVVLVVAAPLYSYIIPIYGAIGAASVLVTVGLLRTVLTAILAGRVSSIVRTFPFWRALAGATAAVLCYVVPRLVTGPFMPFEHLEWRALGLLAFFGVTLLGLAMHGSLSRNAFSALKRGYNS